MEPPILQKSCSQSRYPKSPSKMMPRRSIALPVCCVLPSLLLLLLLIPASDAFLSSQRAFVARPPLGIKSSPPIGATTSLTSKFGPHQPKAATIRLYAKEEKEEEESLTFEKALHKYRVLLRCVWAIVAYMAVGVVAFSRIFEQWPVVDSLYFSVVTFTTVGYGDLIPTTEAGKLFTIFYSFAGISIVGALLGYVGGTVVEAERAAIKKTRAAARAAMMELFDPRKKKGKGEADSDATSRVSRAVEGDSNEDDDNGSSTSKLPGLNVLRNILSKTFAIKKRRDGSKSLLRNAFDTFTDSYYIFVPFLSLAYYMGKKEGWTPITSMYYALATATTVGYGDVSPTSPRMRLLSLAFIPLAVISLGEVLGRIAGYFIRKESTRAEREFMERRMTLDDLEAMDTDKNGHVDLFEFLTFMLGSMQKVDMELMDDLKSLFEKLDASGDGFIEKEDLVMIAKRKRDPWSLRRKRNKSG